MNLTNDIESSHEREVRGCGYKSRGRGKGNFRGRDCGNNFSQERGNDFKPPSQGRGGNNFGVPSRGRGRGIYRQVRTNFNCFHCRKYGHKAADCRLGQMNQNNFNTQANIAENQYQNINENSNPQSLFLTSNSCAEVKIHGI